MNTTLDRLIEIENERQETMNDPKFQKWSRYLKVSVEYKDKEPIYRAKEMMRDYDYNRMFSRQRSFNIFSLIKN